MARRRPSTRARTGRAGDRCLPGGGPAALKYRVVFYCPDRHILYDGRTPDEVGVGGGITGRVRMARALRRLGHESVMVVNCPRHEWTDGVEYVPLDDAPQLEGDVLLANTSGGEYDLSAVRELKLHFRLKLVWTSGIAAPKGLEHFAFDVVYAKSNFLRHVVRSDWGLGDLPVFVAYNGFDEHHFAEAENAALSREPYRLVYASHPSKGLQAAMGVTERLRAEDPRYHLVVFGGPKLWGQAEGPFPRGDGISYRGLIGQAALARELFQATFSLHLQTRLEPFGMSLTEAMRAGCIALASPVGAYPELVRDGHDGFLIVGDPSADVVLRRAARQILELTQDREWLRRMSENARAVPWNTDVMARVWTEHWDWWLCPLESRDRFTGEISMGPCVACGAAALRLLDGEHCVACGRYQRAETIAESLESR